MKKLLAIIFILAVGLIGYWYTTSKTTSSSQETQISASLPSDEADEVENQTETLPAGLVSPSPDGATVFLIEPSDGATVSSPVAVKFGIAGMEIAPAGQNIDNTGHHHLLINLEELPALNQPLPASDQLIHYGAGQTEDVLELETGQHTLQLVLGNYLHIPHAPPVISKKITITVE